MNTRMQFIDMVKAYLENNNIALIGPFKIGIEQTEDPRMLESKLLLSVTGEVKYVISSTGGSSHVFSIRH